MEKDKIIQKVLRNEKQYVGTSIKKKSSYVIENKETRRKIRRRKMTIIDNCQERMFWRGKEMRKSETKARIQIIGLRLVAEQKNIMAQTSSITSIKKINSVLQVQLVTTHIIREDESR